MTGKQKRANRRAEQFARWCERKAARLPESRADRMRLYKDAAKWARRHKREEKSAP